MQTNVNLPDDFVLQQVDADDVEAPIDLQVKLAVDLFRTLDGLSLETISVRLNDWIMPRRNLRGFNQLFMCLFNYDLEPLRDACAHAVGLPEEAYGLWDISVAHVRERGGTNGRFALTYLIERFAINVHIMAPLLGPYTLYKMMATADMQTASDLIAFNRERAQEAKKAVDRIADECNLMYSRLDRLENQYTVFKAIRDENNDIDAPDTIAADIPF